MSVQSQLCGSVTFGQVGVLDTEVRDGPDQRRSSPLGWFQGAMTGTPACCRRWTSYSRPGGTVGPCWPCWARYRTYGPRSSTLRTKPWDHAGHARAKYSENCFHSWWSSRLHSYFHAIDFKDENRVEMTMSLVWYSSLTRQLHDTHGSLCWHRHGLDDAHLEYFLTTARVQSTAGWVEACRM